MHLVNCAILGKCLCRHHYVPSLYFVMCVLDETQVTHQHSR